MMLGTDAGEHCVQALNRDVWITGVPVFQELGSLTFYWLFLMVLVTIQGNILFGSETQFFMANLKKCFFSVKTSGTF